MRALALADACAPAARDGADTLYYDTKIDYWLDRLIVDNQSLWLDGSERKK